MTADIEVDGLTLQKSEVAEVKWVSPSTLKKMIEQKKFHNYGREYFKAIFSYCDNAYNLQEKI
jgi:isopentenyldiphosphate isomerase